MARRSSAASAPPIVAFWAASALRAASAQARVVAGSRVAVRFSALSTADGLRSAASAAASSLRPSRFQALTVALRSATNSCGTSE